MVLGRRWDYLAWNRAACALFGDFGSIPRAARNHLWLMFMDPIRREMFTDWEQQLRLPAPSSAPTAPATSATRRSRS